MNIADQIMRRADRAFAEASGRILIEDLSPMERKAIEDDMERKARYVRTPAGVRRFKRPIGAIILPRGGSLDQIRIKDPVFKGFDLVEDRKGNLYDVGKDPASGGKYVVLKHNTWDDQIKPQDSLDKALEALNEKLGGGTNSDREEGEKPAPKAKKPAPKKTPSKEPSSDSKPQASAPSKGNTSTAEIVDGKFVITTPDGKKHTRTATGKKPYTHALIRKNKEGSGSDRYFVNFATDEGKVHRESRIGAADRSHNEIIELPTSGNDAPSKSKPQGDAPASEDQASKEPTPTEQARERDAQVQAPFKRDKKTFDDAAAALRKDPKTARESRLEAMEKSIRQREAQLKSPNARRNLTAGMRRGIEEDIARDKKTLHNLRNPQDAPTPEKFIENLLMSDRQSYEALSEKGKAAYRAEIQKHIDKDVHSTNSRYAALRVGQAADRDERARNTFAGNGLREYNKLTEKQKDAVFSDINNLMDPQDALRKQVTGKAPANAQRVARERALERRSLSDEGQSRYDSSRRSGSTHQEAIDAARAYDRNNNPNWSDATRPKPKTASKGAQGSPERDAFIESHPKIKDVTDYHKPKLRDMSEKNFEAYVAAVEGGKSPNSIGPIMDRIDAGASWNPVTEKWVGQNSTKRPTSPTPTGDTSASDAADAAVRDRVQKMKDADRSKGRTNPYTSSLKPHQKDEVDALTPGEYATYMNARDGGHGHQGALHRAKNQPKVTYFGALRDADDAIKNAKKNLSSKQTLEEQEYDLKNRQKRLQEANAELGRHRAALPQKLDQMTSEQKAQEKEILAKYQAIDDAENAILRKRRAVMKKREDLAGQRDRDAAQNQKNREARESAEEAGKFGNTATFVSKNQDLLKEVVTLGRSGKNPAPHLPEVRERLAEIDKRLSWTNDELGGYHKGKGKAESDERAAQFRSTLQSQRSRYQKAVDLIESQSKPKGGDKPSSSSAPTKPRLDPKDMPAPKIATGPVKKGKTRYVGEVNGHPIAVDSGRKAGVSHVVVKHSDAGAYKARMQKQLDDARRTGVYPKNAGGYTMSDTQIASMVPSGDDGVHAVIYSEHSSAAAAKRAAESIRNTHNDGPESRTYVVEVKPQEAQSTSSITPDALRQRAEGVNDPARLRALAQEATDAMTDDMSTDDMRALAKVRREMNDRADAAEGNSMSSTASLAASRGAWARGLERTSLPTFSAEEGVANKRRLQEAIDKMRADRKQVRADMRAGGESPHNQAVLKKADEDITSAINAAERTMKQMDQNRRDRHRENREIQKRNEEIAKGTGSKPSASEVESAHDTIRGLSNRIGRLRKPDTLRKAIADMQAARDVMDRNGERENVANIDFDLETHRRRLAAMEPRPASQSPSRPARVPNKPQEQAVNQQASGGRDYREVAKEREERAAYDVWNGLPTRLPEGQKYGDYVLDWSQLNTMGTDELPSVPEMNRAIRTLEAVESTEADETAKSLTEVRDWLKGRIDQERAEFEAANTSLFGDDLSIPEPTPAPRRSPAYTERPGDPGDGPFRRGADRLRRAGITEFTPNQARQVDEMNRDQWEAAQGRVDAGESISDVLGSTATRNRRDPMAPPPVSRDEVQRRLAERRAAREAAAQALIDSEVPNYTAADYTAIDAANRRAESRRVLNEANSRQTWANMNDRMGVTMTPAGQAAATAQGDISEFIDQVSGDLSKTRTARAWARDRRNVQRYQEILRSAEEAYANDPNKSNALYNSIQRLRFMVGKQIEKHNPQGVNLRPRKAVGATSQAYNRTRPAGR